MSSFMIELKNVQKSYDGGATLAVADTSLTIERGEFLGLIGASGCGKTTTLKMINRLEEPSSGEILVNGRNVVDQNPEQLRRNIGYVFQGIGLFPHRTVAENVAAVPQLLQWSVGDIRARCEECMEMVGLPFDEYEDRYPSQLSGGQQQRVALARALAARPEVVLMDEPFGALDPITRSELQEEFKSIQKNMALTVVMVTHDMTEALLLGRSYRGDARRHSPADWHAEGVIKQSISRLCARYSCHAATASSASRGVDAR